MIALLHSPRGDDEDRRADAASIGYGPGTPGPDSHTVAVQATVGSKTDTQLILLVDGNNAAVVMHGLESAVVARKMLAYHLTHGTDHDRALVRSEIDTLLRAEGRSIYEGLMTEAFQRGFTRGSADARSRASVRPGDGDMGG